MEMAASSAAAPALGLARRRADPPANGGKRVGLASDDVGIFVAALGNGLHVAAGIRVHRAADPAGYLALEVTDVWYLDVIGRWHGDGAAGEIRNPKAEGRKKSEVRNPNLA